MSKLVSLAEVAMWELVDKIGKDFAIATYSAAVQTEHLRHHPNHHSGPLGDGEPAIYLGIKIGKEDERVSKLPLDFDCGGIVVPVCYYFVQSAPAPQ